jgi:hypothetical protein
MYHLVFRVQDHPRTYNKLARLHWSKIAKEAKKWHEIVMYSTAGKRPSVPLSKAFLRLTRASSAISDFDGLVSSFKYVIDGLVVNHVLKNDTPLVIGSPEYRWTKEKGKKGWIEVEVWDAEAWAKENATKAP